MSQYLRSMEGCRLACTIRRRTTQNHPPPPPFGMLNHYWLASPTPSSLVPVFPNNSLVPTCTLEGERGTVRVKRLALKLNKNRRFHSTSQILIGRVNLHFRSPHAKLCATHGIQQTIKWIVFIIIKLYYYIFIQ